MNRRIVDADVLVNEYRELLKDEKIEALPLTVSGNSMSPWLIDQRDVVYLSCVKREIRKGDVLLYQRADGSYVLHRVYDARKDKLVMIGDGQSVLEAGIGQDQVIAIVSAVVRKGQRFDSHSFWWQFFEKVWIRMIPLRGIVMKAVNALRG